MEIVRVKLSAVRVKSARQTFRWGHLGGLLLVATLLAACGAPMTPSPTPSPQPVVSPTVPQPTRTPTPTPPVQPLVVTLTLWVPEEFNPYEEESPAADLLSQRLADFNGLDPTLQVQVVVKKAQGRGGLLDFLRTASVAAPSVLPDLIVLNTADLKVAAQAGLLYPLGTLLSEDLAASRYPFASALGEVDGQAMGVTFAANVQHLAYRPALFSSVPVTWTDVISAPAPLIFPAGREESVSDFTLIQYLAAGGHMVDGEGGALLEEEPLIQVLSFYEEAVAAGVISPSIVLEVGENVDCLELLADPQVGMAAVNSHCYWSQLAPEVALTPLPTPDGQAISLAEGWTMALVVTPEPARQDMALRLMEWLLAPEYLGPWTQSEGYLPGTLDGLENWTVTAEERTILEALLEGAVPVPDPTIRTLVGPPLQEAVEAVLRGRRSAEDAAAEAVRTLSP